jgi:hypothetical protein
MRGFDSTLATPLAEKGWNALSDASAMCVCRYDIGGLPAGLQRGLCLDKNNMRGRWGVIGEKIGGGRGSERVGLGDF